MDTHAQSMAPRGVSRSVHAPTQTNNFFNRCSNQLTETMKALKCKPSMQFAYNYIAINVLSKCSNIISHQSSAFEGRHNDHRSSKVDTSIIHLRRSTHLSSILEGRHIDRRSSKVDTSIFDGRHIDHRSSKVDTHRSSKI